MSQTAPIAIHPVIAYDGSAEGLRLDADFNARWTAWQTRGRLHERTVRRRLRLLVPVAIAAAGLVYLVLVR